MAREIATYDAKVEQGKGAAATSRGRIDFRATPQYEIALTTNRLDIQKLQNRRIIHTDLNLTAQVKGSGIKLDDADAVARVDVKRSVLGPAQIDSGAIRASIARGMVRIAQASLVAGDTKVSTKGQVALAGKQRGDLSYDLASGDISPVDDAGGAQRRRQGAGHRTRERTLQCADGERQRLDARRSTAAAFRSAPAK